jgi:hypothetical protein
MPMRKLLKQPSGSMRYLVRQDIELIAKGER